MATNSKKWSSPSVTNTLLLINAVFLLALVINTSSDGRRPSPHDQLAHMGAPPSVDEESPMVNPHAHEEDTAEGAPADGGFNVQNMALAALKCPSDATITLSDASCKGAEAEKRKAFVSQLGAQKLPPRLLFDKIIEKFGEAALTDEALEIRKANRSR